MSDISASFERHSLAGVETVPVAEIRPGLTRGDIFVVRNCLQAAGSFAPLRAMVLETIEGIGGAAKRREADERGLAAIHKILPLDLLMKMSPVLTRRARAMAASVVANVAENLLQLGSDVHFEDGPNVRMFVPHDLAARHQAALGKFVKENGSGRMTLHGPHQDGRHFHPKGAINVWCAIDEVEIGNGMTIFPEFYGEQLPFTEPFANIRPDQYLGRPVTMPLAPGDAMVFETLHLHSSTVNQTDRTRFVISFRITCDVPQHPGKVWYNYVRPRECGPDGPPPWKIDYRKMPDRGPVTRDTSRSFPPALAPEKRRGGELAIASASIGEGDVRAVSPDLCIARVGGEAVVFSRRCPHEGADLAGASVHEGQIVCPWHGLRMSAKDGRSGCSAIPPLRVIPCREEGGAIFLSPAPASAA